jgi:hypothetical protein
MIVYDLNIQTGVHFIINVIVKVILLWNSRDL